jgi:hypothetical protein
MWVKRLELLKAHPERRFVNYASWNQEGFEYPKEIIEEDIKERIDWLKHMTKRCENAHELGSWERVHLPSWKEELATLERQLGIEPTYQSKDWEEPKEEYKMSRKDLENQLEPKNDNDCSRGDKFILATIAIAMLIVIVVPALWWLTNYAPVR